MNARHPALVLAVCSCLAFSPALAAPRTVAVSAGDCEEPALQGLSRAFSDSLRARLGDQLQNPDEATGQLRPKSSASREDIQRQLTLAQKHFYNLQQFKAEQQVDEALAQIDKLPAGPERRALSNSAFALRGVFRLGSNKPAQADEAFTQILRLEPSYQLDPDYYSPSTRERFEQVRKKVAGTPKKSLQVHSTPVGADVYLDGQLVGKTPLNTKVLPGKYQVRLVKGSLYSFPHTMEFSADAALHVDLAFEGAVKPGQMLCITELPTRAELLTAAGKLGAQLGMEEVVLIRVRRNSAGSDWLTATLVSVQSGQDLREGGMKIPPSPPPGAFDDLVAYVATGRAGPAVVVAQGSAAPWANAVAPAPRPEAQTAQTGEPTTVATTPSRGFMSGWRSKAWIPAAAGGALVAGGIIFMANARATESALRRRDPAITDVDGAVSRGQTQETVGYALLIPGVVGLGLAGAMFIWGGDDDPEPEPVVTIVPVNGGGVSVFSTTW